MNDVSCMALPVWEFDEDGAVKSNLIFHRPLCEVRSRCIEYPWAASRYDGGASVLDVGSAKGMVTQSDQMHAIADQLLVERGGQA